MKQVKTSECPEPVKNRPLVSQGRATVTDGSSSEAILTSLYLVSSYKREFGLPWERDGLCENKHRWLRCSGAGPFWLRKAEFPANTHCHLSPAQAELGLACFQSLETDFKTKPH